MHGMKHTLLQRKKTLRVNRQRPSAYTDPSRRHDTDREVAWPVC
jgi:hypothetical protein